MTLSARIAIPPSRRLERLATMLPVGGCVAAAVTLGVRWPQSLVFVAVSLLAACVAVVASARRRRRPALTMTVSRHPEVDIQPDPDGGTGPWRLAESTMAWPGFALLALRPFDRSITAPVVRVPVFSTELYAADRRALDRFLIWSMRGGANGDVRSARA